MNLPFVSRDGLSGNNLEVMVIVDGLYHQACIFFFPVTNLEHIFWLSLKLDVALQLVAKREELGTGISMGHSLCFFPFLIMMQMDLGTL